jgi:hypothetical protein
MSKCCQKKKSRSFSNRRESRKNPPPMPKRTPPSKNHPPLDAEERATIANLMKNIFQRFVPPEPDLTEPIGPRNIPFGDNRLQSIKHILDARAAQCKTAYLAKQNISTLKDANGDDHLVAKQNPFTSRTDQNEEPLVAKQNPFASHISQNEEPFVEKKNPPPAWDETPLIGKNESRSLRPKVDDGPRPPGRPLWMPEGTDLERMPVEIRQAVAEILRPAYEELVDQAGSGMEKSLGTSLVHLLWLEILEQYDIKKDYCKFDLLLEVDGTRGFAIDRYLKLVNSKLRLSSMLTRLRQLRLKEQKTAAQPLNVQNSNFDDENQPPLPNQKAPIVQKQEFDDKSQSPSSRISNLRSEIPQQSSTQDLNPKAQDQIVQNSNFAHENQPSLPNQKAPIVQKQEFDDENQSSGTQISNFKSEFPQQFSTQDLKPTAQDPFVQNSKFAHENLLAPSHT